MRTITNSDDIIDSRDIIARIEELQGERDSWEESGEGTEWEAENPDDAEKLKTLESLAEEGKTYSGDWEYGAILIHEDHFTDYCQELVSDTGDLSSDILNYLVIDWEATAENIRQYYSKIDFDGQTYLVR